mmetsp:Transcript_10750/g.44436  ORF Transcript_10750/g.44436 Transcript_10750/m.44436 type:complete len:276 (-) Transcript_10750:393-1220(-)
MLSPRYWCRRGYSIRATHRCAAPTPPGERRRGRWQAAPAGRAVAARTTACTGLRNDASEERTGASERVGSRHVRTGADVRQGAARSCERGRLAAQSAWTQSASTLAVLTFQSDSKGGTADVFRRGLELRHLSFQREAAIHQRGEDLLGAGVHAAFAFQQARVLARRRHGDLGVREVGFRVPQDGVSHGPLDEGLQRARIVEVRISPSYRRLPPLLCARLLVRRHVHGAFVEQRQRARGGVAQDPGQREVLRGGYVVEVQRVRQVALVDARWRVQV